MAISIKCPNCTANLLFDADSQNMICQYCGTSISPNDIHKEQHSLHSEAMRQEEKKDAQIQAEYAKDTSADKTDGASSKEHPEESMFSEGETVQFVCNSCGAAVLTDRNTSATFCAFCGSPAIIPERLTDVRRPHFVIPFKYGRENAINSFLKWCKAGRFTPIDFVKSENIEKITGLYVPFWLFSAVIDMDYEASCKKVSSYTVGNKVTTKTKHYRVVRKKKVSWSRIPYDGSKDIDDDMMALIEPYNYDDLVEFDMKYLAGFFSNRYDVPSEAFLEKLKERLYKYLDKIFSVSVQFYTSVHSKKNRSKYYKPDVQYALLPVWILNYQYLGKRYTFVMNGQTGKVAGEPPVSWLKLLLLGIALLPLAAIVFKLIIGGFILGGFF